MLALASLSMDTENRFVIYQENGLKLVVQLMLEHPLQVWDDKRRPLLH